MKWIIVSCDYGRLGNRLHTHANILAWCIKNNNNLINLSFRSFSNCFESQIHHSSGSYFQNGYSLFHLLKLNFIYNFLERLILSEKWLKRLSFFFYIIEKDNFSTLEEHELDIIKTNRIIIIKTWDIRCPNSLKMVGQTVKNLLQPASSYLQKANSFVTDLKKSYNCLVGIHARRGDYETYLGGKHYHSWESYQIWALEVKNVLESNGYNKIGFILCSDETPPQKILKNSFIHFTATNHFMDDLHTLTLCDYNIGPPSSYGTWVSWFGKLPRLVVYKNTEISSLDQFEICSTC